MPKIQRETQKIFCNSADSDQLAVFGSMATGVPVYSNNIEDLQNNEAFDLGWDAATLEDKAPFMEEMNGMQYGITKQLAYNFQEGIPEYDAGTTYYVGSICKVLEEGKPVLYTSLTDENLGNNPVTDATNWERLSFGGGSGFNLFDTKISDHVLEGDSAIGWALQGTYVDGAVYPDFYAKCLEEYNEATETETVNGVTVKVNSNGHKFYNIADKASIDNFFNTMGSAWFYGVDTENERIFLPRDKYFAVTGGVAGDGKTLGLTDGTNFGGLAQASDDVGAMISLYGTPIGTPRSGSYLKNGSIGITTDPTKSGIVLDPNEDKYLYICVGNTVVNEDQIDVGQVLSQAVLRSSLEEVQTVIETYQNGTSWYRVWSDGWCEQGGVAGGTNAFNTITLLKPYKSINYHVSCMTMTNETGTFSSCACTTESGGFTSSQFTVIQAYYGGGKTGRFVWKASGYIW